MTAIQSEKVNFYCVVSFLFSCIGSFPFQFGRSACCTRSRSCNICSHLCRLTSHVQIRKESYLTKYYLFNRYQVHQFCRYLAPFYSESVAFDTPSAPRHMSRLFKPSPGEKLNLSAILQSVLRLNDGPFKLNSHLLRVFLKSIILLVILLLSPRKTIFRFRNWACGFCSWKIQPYTSWLPSSRF